MKIEGREHVWSKDQRERKDDVAPYERSLPAVSARGVSRDSSWEIPDESCRIVGVGA